MVFKRHVTVMNPAVRDVAQNAADRVQSDSLRQHSAEIPAAFQVIKNLLEQLLGFLFPDIGNDPRRVDDAVNGTQAIQGSLHVGPHFFSIQMQGASPS